MAKRIIIGLATLALLLGALPMASLASEGPDEEFRAYWVDAFGEGIFNEAEVDELVAAAKAANMNAIVAQIGRRGDCFCNDAIMPRTQAAIAPLPTVSGAAAHREGAPTRRRPMRSGLWPLHDRVRQGTQSLHAERDHIAGLEPAPEPGLVLDLQEAARADGPGPDEVAGSEPRIG